ncbi:unnamed protein product [Caenorhabditis auriculariae]|uniref:Uncharacterized protein n=1 Tax=Caenorhabditis auriculariae TaxID=2777116 RepID=A0A8S1H3I7_9PELO|nr:unnamed protein product [Caenorhabditis auriculariae]
MSSFDAEDRRAKYAVVPKSVNDGKVVELSQKTVQSTKQVRKVLPEEQYISKLERIIVKDYFPELPKLQAQREYMDAVASNDVAKIRELQVRFRTTRRTDRRTSPSAHAISGTPLVGKPDRPTSPLNFDPATPGPSTSKASEAPLDDPYSTPLPYSNAEGDNEADLKKKKKKEVEMSVTGYLNSFTSEDNASFEELTEVMRERERAKRHWVYEAEERHNKNSIIHSLMPAEADVQLAIKYTANAEEERPIAVDNWKYTAWNTILFNPEGVPMSAEESAAAALKQQIVINKSATRFPDDVKNKPSEESMSRAAMIQAANKAGKVDVLGHEIGATKTMGILATPSPAPGVEDSPLMTWGEIDGTPFRLDAPDVSAPTANAPTFKMPEVPYREQIAQGINDTIAMRYRDKRKVAMKAAEGAHSTPRFGGASKRTSEKLALLSPAAQRLATNKLGIQMRTGSSSSFSKTPVTPSERTPGSTRKPLHRTPVTSMIRRRETPTPSTTSTTSLTDNLLHIEPSPERKEETKSRARAGDFF